MKSCALMSLFLLCAALALAALAFLLIQASPATEARRQADLEYQRQRDAQDLADRAKKAEQTARYVDAILPATEAAGTLVILGIPLAAGVAGYAWLRRRHRDHGEIVLLDGATPLPRQRLLSGFYDDLLHGDVMGRRAADVEKARNPVHQLPPMLRTYSPRYGNHAAPRPTASDPNAPQALAAPPPSLRDKLPSSMPASLLLRAGYRPTADKLLLGMGNGYPIWTPAGCHVAIAGPTGAGKDHAARLLLTQVVAAVPQARAYILDPHHVWRDPADGCDLTPLEAAGVEAVTEKAEIAAFLDWLSRGELQQRIRARRAGQAVGAPTWVLVNEAPAVLADYPDVSKNVKALVNEGRKFGLFLILASQDFLAATLKESSIRAQLTTAVNLGADAYTARALGVVPPAEAGPLGKGVGYVRTGQDAPQLARLPLFDADAPRLLLPAPPTGPRNDSASWGTSATYSTGGEPLRAYTPPPDPPAQTPLPPADGRTEGRKVDADDAQSGQNQPAPSEPTDRPTYRPPTTLTGKARAAGMPLSPDEWDYLARVDRGQSPQTIARDVTGQDGGRRYSRVRDEVARLADMVRNWPDGEQWADGSEGNADA